MTEINTSMYAPQAQANPLGSIAGIVSLQNAMAQGQNLRNQNALFQQTFAARQAVGSVVQSAVDPQTGQIDYSKAAVMLSTNPQTAFIAPEILNAWTQRQLTQQQTVEKALQVAQLKMGAIGNAAASLVSDGHANGDKVDLGKVISATALLKGQGIITSDDQMNFLTNLGKDPSQVYARLLQVAQQSQGAEKSLGATFNAISTPAGGATQLGARNVYAGTYEPARGGAIEHVPTPAERSAATPFINPQTGQPMTGARQDVLPMYGGLGTPIAPSQGAQGPQSWSPSSAPITGSPQGSTEAGTTTNAPGDAAAPAAARGIVPTGLSPVQSEGLKYVTEKYTPDLVQRTQGGNNLKLLMSQAQDETKNFKLGGGASMYMKMGQLGQSIGLSSDAVNKLANGDLASSQAANKLFLQVGSQIAAQLVHAGGGRMTQTEWSKVLGEGSANVDLDPKAVAKIFAAMREAVHYTNMESQAFSAARKRYDAGQYDLSQFPTDWSNSLSGYLDRRERGPERAK